MQTNWPEPRYFLYYHSSHAARKLLGYYNRELAPLGITAQQMLALGVLWEEDRLSLGEFAKRAGIGKAAAVAMIKRLEALDLVTTGPHPVDARLNVIRITDHARELAPRVLEKVGNLEKRLEEEIGESALRTLADGLSIINKLDL